VASSLEEIDAVFFALGHQARRHIVLLLNTSGGELPSGYLAKRFHHSWPTTTRHLRCREVRLVSREGPNRQGSANPASDTAVLLHPRGSSG
jgi:hypothetical protein